MGDLLRAKHILTLSLTKAPFPEINILRWIKLLVHILSALTGLQFLIRPHSFTISFHWRTFNWDCQELLCAKHVWNLRATVLRLISSLLILNQTVMGPSRSVLWTVTGSGSPGLSGDDLFQHLKYAFLDRSIVCNQCMKTINCSQRPYNGRGRWRGE